MELFKKRLVLSLVVGIILLFSMSMVTAATSAQTLDGADVEKFLDAVMQRQMAQLNIPNATFSVVAGGEVIMAKGYGYADLDQQIPVDPDKTLFRIGSTSKLFTWTAVMQLVEQGKLDLDVDVNEYLDFEIPARLLYGEGQAEPEPITIKHLMTHTPGFEDYMSHIFLLSDEELLPLDQYLREYMPARVFPAGAVIAYSNYGTALAGHIVERVSGVPFAQYIEENIYEPLGMGNSTFRQPLPADLAGNMAKAYRYVDGEFREGKFEFIRGNPSPAGSMSSTAFDMARFMLAHLASGQQGGATILKEETARQMFSQLFTHHPRLDGMAHGFIEGMFNERRTLFHPGGTMLFDTGFYLLPEEQVGLFLSLSGGNPLVYLEVFQAFMDRYFPAQDPAVASPLPAAGMAERSSEFAGEYRQNRRSFTTSDKFISLMMGQIHVFADEEGYLLVTHMGETNRFVEIEPGVYHNLREGRTQDYGGDFRTIVFGTDPLGKTLLMASGPMSYSKAAWYETSTLNFLMLVLAVLVVMGSLLYWGIKAVIKKIRYQKSGEPPAVSQLAKLARGAALAYGFLTIALVVETVIVGEPDPVYGLPAMAYGEMPAWSSLFNLVPLMMAIVGVGVVICAVLAWWKGYWRTPGRIHYTLFAVATMVLLWFFWFWNIFI